MPEADTKKVTIHSIAENLGVSAGTVSYVLSGQGRKRNVAKKTIAKVNAAAKKLNYSPNFWARSLAQSRTGIVSVMFSDLKGDWAHRAMAGILKVFRPKNYIPVISLYERSFLTEDVEGIGTSEVDLMLQRRDEGLICQPIPPARDEYVRLASNGMKLVLIGSQLEDMAGLENVSSVTWDCGLAVKALVQHLIRSGRKRIAFFGSRHGVNSDITRFEAYKETLEEAGLEVRDEWVKWGLGYKFAEEASLELKSLLVDNREKPDAIFAINDAVALGIMQLLSGLNIKTPDDIALTGMGNLYLGGFPLVGLTTVKEPIERMGHASAEMMIELFDNPQKGPIHRKIECNELIIRKTTGGDTL